ncbi:MAG: DHH family phosphoesterase [Desulfobacterales bacterium]
MKQPIGKSVSSAEKYRKLRGVIDAEDTLAVLINADPDAMASALALRRLFWDKTRKIHIFRINRIERADNLAFVKLLDFRHDHIRSLKKSGITKWALLDSQPSHNEMFSNYAFDIIIDHHPVSQNLESDFIDIREEYGANSTIMTEYIKAANIKPSPRLATALFYGIKSDTNNFIRPTVPSDIIAFRYLYDFVNMNIIKKIESSEMKKKMLPFLKKAIEKFTLVGDTAVFSMGKIDHPDTLVVIADFFLNLAEASMSIVSGVFEENLVIIFRNAGFRRHVGKLANEMAGDIGSAGGHSSAARAEIPIGNIDSNQKQDSGYRSFIIKRLKSALSD